MSIDYDYKAEATAAMRMAAATCEPHRSGWLRVALAWQDLTRDQDKLSPSFLQPLLPPTSLRGIAPL
jgi:hypothetical protein